MLKKIRKWIPHIIVVAAVLALLPMVLRLRPEDIAQFTPQNLFAAALIIIGIFILKNILVIIPLTVLYVACGMMFGVGWGIVVALVGLTCEISIGYYVGKKRGKKRIIENIIQHPKATDFRNLLDDNPQSACFLSRLFPLPLPVDVVSMYFGSLGTPFPTYLGFSLLGLGSKMLPYVVAGKSITNPLSVEFLGPLGIGITISVGIFFFQRVYKSHHTVQNNKDDGT